MSLPRIRRELRPGDYGAIVEMHGRLYAREYGLDSSFEAHVAAGVTRAAMRGFPREREGLWVVERDGEFSGSLGLTDEDGVTGMIRWVLLDPAVRGHGVGRQLIEHAFPVGRGDVRSIIATTDVRAAARYYAADTVARFPYFTLAGKAHADAETADLTAEPVGTDARALAAVTVIERAVLGYARGSHELRWLAGTRPGYLFTRGGEPIGFAFVAEGAAGPIAALEPADVPAILGHVERLTVGAGSDELELEIPGVNDAAIRHMLGRGFHIDPWINLLMSNRPFGRFDRYIGFSPPIFL